MADINKLAVLTNLAGGDLNGLANEMQIDAQILETALQFGESGLTRNDKLELDEKLARYERLELDEYAQAEIEDYTEKVNDLEDRFNNSEHINDIRQALITDKITLEDIENMELLSGQGGFTLHIENTIMQWLNDESNNAKTFLDLFAQDGYRIDVRDSEFWEWYRNTFYND